MKSTINVMHTNDKKLELAYIEIALQNKEKDRRAYELILANAEKEKRANELALANIELAYQNKEKDKRANELILANAEKEKRANELTLANIELTYQNKEKDKRANELILANAEKEKRANELIIANIELAYQNKEKDKRANELILANAEKEKRANELIIANIELAYQNKEKDKRANELIITKQHQDLLEHIVQYDILTALPNRSLLADRLSLAILQCTRQQKALGVAFLDLDGFKAVNDLHGHGFGDDLLIGLSCRMKDALRDSDTLARLGGDEFVAVFTDLSDVEECKPLLDRLLNAASKPITINNVVIELSVSIGITFYPQDFVTAEQLIYHADKAMYVAKESGKGCYHIFDKKRYDEL